MATTASCLALGEAFMDYPGRRRQRLARLLTREGVDAFLISNPVNVTYLTGFSGESSYLVLGCKQTLLVSDARFTEQIAEECPGLAAHIRPPAQTLWQRVQRVAKGQREAKGGKGEGKGDIAEAKGGKGRHGHPWRGAPGCPWWHPIGRHAAGPGSRWVRAVPRGRRASSAMPGMHAAI
jgi:hypothetical protein